MPVALASAVRVHECVECGRADKAIEYLQFCYGFEWIGNMNGRYKNSWQRTLWAACRRFVSLVHRYSFGGSRTFRVLLKFAIIVLGVHIVQGASQEPCYAPFDHIERLNRYTSGPTPSLRYLPISSCQIPAAALAAEWVKRWKPPPHRTTKKSHFWCHAFTFSIRADGDISAFPFALVTRVDEWIVCSSTHGLRLRW